MSEKQRLRNFCVGVVTSCRWRFQTKFTDLGLILTVFSPCRTGVFVTQRGHSVTSFQVHVFIRTAFSKLTLLTNKSYLPVSDAPFLDSAQGMFLKMLIEKLQMERCSNPHDDCI